MAPKKIRVLIVDDSIFFQKTLQTGLQADPRIEVVGFAGSAMEAMARIDKLNPDVVTLDVEMPQMNGIDFLKKLIPTHPVPVIVVSGMPIQVLDALDVGAVDFVRKPNITSSQDLKAFFGELLVKVKIASMANVRGPASVTHLSASLQTLTGSGDSQRVIAIGASTGGTEAILEVVQELPPTMPGIVVVQHMPPVFTQMYAQRLDRICKMRVVEATDGARVEPGKIIIAAGDAHLRLAKGGGNYFVKSRPGEKVSGHCPSVDVLFESVAQTAGSKAIGVILTGMGADGAKGLLKMRQAGAYTIGQDKDTSIVYGMPQAAFASGAVTTQLPLEVIGGALISQLNKSI